MFIDTAKIKIKAGDGGDGAVSFHREKYVAAGGPDGGDGGRGGSVVFQVDDNLSTLADFRYKRKYAAQRGENGRGNRCFGKSAPGPGDFRAPWHPYQGRRDRPPAGGHVRRRAPGHRQGRQGRLGKHPLCHPHPAGAPVCQARAPPARSWRSSWS